MMTALGILWYILVFVLIIGYFVLDGFDLGVGVLYPFIAKDEQEKATLRKAIGPVWDGNEVWLLTGGGALFAAFAPAYATSFSGFYLAIMLVLFGLILRAVSLEFRSHTEDAPKLWDAFFFLGSLLPALLFGVAVGNVIQGIPLDANGDYTGSFFALLNPFALICGLLGLVHMLVQGLAWIAQKAPVDGQLRDRAVSLRGKLILVAMALFILATLVFFFGVKDGLSYEPGSVAIAAVCGIFYVALLCAAWALGNKGKDLAPFLLVSIAAAMLVILGAATLFPNLIPATDATLSLTIANSAATDATLLPMTIIACIGVPIMLVYHVIVYRVFRGRLD